MKKQYYVGVDLGGTKIISCPVELTKKFKILGREKVETGAHNGEKKVISRIARTIINSIEKSGLNLKQIKGVGLGVPGTVDQLSGKILFAANLGWKNIKIKKVLEKKLNLPVFVDNDVNLGTLAEQQFGAAKKVENVAGVYWGTGIGGGLIINGRIVHGFSFTAGEIGHMILDKDGRPCGCGSRGCLETFSAKWAITAAVNEAGKKQDGQSGIKRPGVLKSSQIRKAMKQDDKQMTGVMAGAIEYLGIALANIVNVINPEIIVLGGGVVESMEKELIPRLEQVMKSYTVPFAQVKLKAAELGDYSVLAGAAYFAKQQGIHS